MDKLIANAEIAGKGDARRRDGIGPGVVLQFARFIGDRIVPPAGIDSGVIVKEFRNRFNAMIANGQGSMKGQIFRIAHLGFFDFHDLFAVIAELELILAANGYSVKFGTGVAAVQNMYAAAAMPQEALAV